MPFVAIESSVRTIVGGVITWDHTQQVKNRER